MSLGGWGSLSIMTTMTPHSFVADGPTDIPTDAAFLSKRARYGGRILMGLASAFLAFDAVFKLFASPVAIKGTSELGYSPSVIVPLGVVQLVCLAAYLAPRTRVLGALLWTGYLGGAIATHVRVESPLFSHVLFPVYVAAMIWGGIWLTNPRVRALLPLIRKEA
jgi:DoxX-like family